MQKTSEGDRSLRPTRDDDGAILRPLLRYWMVSLPILLLAAGAAFYLDVTAQPSYEASGLLLLTNSAFQPDRVVATVDVRELVEDFGASDEVEVTGEAQVMAADRNATTVEIAGRGPSAALAEEALATGIGWFEERLDEMQNASNADAAFPLSWSLPARPEATLQVGGFYEADAVMTLEAAGGSGANPLGANRDTAELLSTVLTSQQVIEAIEASSGGDVSIGISGPDSIRFPVLGIRTEGHEPDAVLAAFEETVRVAEDELEARQVRADVPLPRRVFLDVVAEPVGATDVTPRFTTASVAALMLGIVAALLVTVMLEARERRRTFDARAAQESYHRVEQGR